jgi:hypothetical protein
VLVLACDCRVRSRPAPIGQALHANDGIVGLFAPCAAVAARVAVRNMGQLGAVGWPTSTMAIHRRQVSEIPMSQDCRQRRDYR